MRINEVMNVKGFAKNINSYQMIVVIIISNVEK